MYNGMKGIIHRRFQKKKITQGGVSLGTYPGTGSVDTSEVVVVRGYESLVIYGSYTGASGEVEINVLPVDIDETTILTTPIATFTLTPSLTNDNISIAPGRPAVAIQVVNKSTTDTAVVTTKIVATWK